MNWKATPPAIETAAISSAAACLGAAVGFAVARTAPFGAELVEASLSGAAVAVIAWLLLWRIDRHQGVGRRFMPVESPSADLVIDDVLLLEERVDHDDELLLDDPLPAVDDESRVVRLFAPQCGATAQPTPFAGPGEMMARIENFLGQARGGATAAEQPRSDRAAADDASAALHAALADIRRSLRQG
ncbi:MAG: hypothetical protein LH466_04150 [Sphingomonas bacterium]|nr:hypothetical protein [Sphingomonas bacterium]